MLLPALWTNFYRQRLGMAQARLRGFHLDDSPLVNEFCLFLLCYILDFSFTLSYTAGNDMLF
jgi:hypothetical protein